MAPATGVVTRTVVLGGKVKRRAYHHAMARVGALQKRSEEAVSKLVHTVDLVRIFIKCFYYGSISILQYCDGIT